MTDSGGSFFDPPDDEDADSEHLRSEPTDNAPTDSGSADEPGPADPVDPDAPTTITPAVTDEPPLPAPTPAAAAVAAPLMSRRLRTGAIAVVVVAACVTAYLLGRSGSDNGGSTASGTNPTTVSSIPQIAHPSEALSLPDPSSTAAGPTATTPTTAAATSPSTKATATKSGSAAHSGGTSTGATHTSPSTKPAGTTIVKPTGPVRPTYTAPHEAGVVYSFELPPNGTGNPGTVTISVPGGAVITSATGPAGTKASGLNTNFVTFTKAAGNAIYPYSFVVDFPPKAPSGQAATIRFTLNGKAQTEQRPL